MPFIIILLFAAVNNFAQSPHGEAFELDCSKCHQATDWKVIPTQLEFNHNEETNFKLIGQHKIVDCRSCHSNLVFSEAPTECFSCHKDIHQNSVGMDCSRCHSPETWIVKEINQFHQNSRFPLIGAHIKADCIQCHSSFSNLNFEPLGITCFDCHSKHYYATSAPNHAAANFSTECQDCHSITGEMWAAENFNHDFFPLVGGHKIQNCFSCHQQGNYKSLSTDCYSCHKQDYELIKDPDHLASGFPTNCIQCHSIQGWSHVSFDHNITAFQLTGAHVNINCASCHSQGFTGTPSNCYACHQNTYNTAANPNHSTAGISTECQSCHNTSAWVPSGFSHTSTGFELIGKHSPLDCSSCHKGTTTGLNQACISCHQTEYNGAENHIAQNYPTNCEMCHNPNGWEQANFNHQTTNFPLTGVHTTTECSSCHQSGFIGTSTICADCHQSNYNATTNPNHAALSVPTDCQACHTTSPGWKPAQFTIHPELLGAHSQIANDCNTCHNGNYNTIPNTCYGCHATDYNNTTNPLHASTGFSTDCQPCHSQNSWSPATFDHDNQFFPIYSGKHNGKWNLCSDCHTNQSNFFVFSCIDCHEHNKQDTDAKHAEVSGYVYASNQCYACHPKGDIEGSFNHSLSSFPLTGAHITVSCIQCHQNGYAGTSTACKACHDDTYGSAVNPNHTAAGLSTECQTCHNTSAWIPSSFNHTNTGFSLTGQHTYIQCSNCHSGTIGGLNGTCISCHQSNYNSAPNHVAQNYPTTCEMCHNSVAWNQTTFNHQTTNYPLSGAHLNVNCSSCHQSGFTGTTTVCSDCHQAAYNASTNPSHTALALPTICQSCHTTNQDWEPATFSIHNNYYQLLGAHTAIQNNCATCHNGNYNTTPNTCYGCHESDYNSTTNPPHQSAGFSIDCQTCHTQNAWSPAAFDHDNQFFPIYSGKHREKWDACSDCHTNPTNYSVFSCITCHEHNQTSMDDKHSDVNGYVYQSEACFNCHPDGDENRVMRRLDIKRD